MFGTPDENLALFFDLLHKKTVFKKCQVQFHLNVSGVTPQSVVNSVTAAAISLGKSVLPPATFLLHGIKLTHILHLRDNQHYNINDIVVLV